MPRHSINSCTFQLHSWKPFTNLTNPNPNPNPNHQHPKTLDSDTHNSNSNPKPKPTTVGNQTKRPCLSDRATSFSLSIDSIDLSKLSLFDDDKPVTAQPQMREKFRWMARKRRRRGSRSVSGRSSDRSGTRNGRCCSVGATATCSDFMVAAGGTDSSGELFVSGNGHGNANANGSGNGNGDVNWGSDVNSRKERREGGVIGERDNSGSGYGFDAQWSESGYGSEPGYRGDAEFGYGDEVDEEEDDARFLFWGERFGDTNREMVGDNTFLEQKNHHRGRRKKT